MTAVAALATALFGLEVVVILACTAVLAWLVARDTTHLLYPEGIRWLAATLAVTAAATTLDLCHMTGAFGSAAADVIAEATYAVAAAFAVGSMWYFARDFVRTENRTFDGADVRDRESDDGGFEDA
ncbi:hypothetical protein MBEHAL_1736 [Halarchaeum acidiphilum MH1-52-1]|uniref:Uncharacterized protein n=1 Tax=Halarchaeum acidiphilum MH1-52-1 TaxID=1261545 RepID=U2YFS8_9EURY|nr:hypothetical protein [Halarchaeum acidiphilum]GAD52976.1 hypothetical protein MBEHAL_1736 [Halarchaeum acidiphilum MH1-52-1]